MPWSYRRPAGSPTDRPRGEAARAVKRTSAVHRAGELLAAVLLCACLPAAARAAESVTLNATLTPERLGQATTVGFGFQIAAPAGRTRPPLTQVDLRYPADLGIAVSGLGVATCSPATLEASGPSGCPADSRMGSGSALAEVPIGPAIQHETTDITIVRAPEQNGHLALFFSADGTSPIIAQIVLPALLLPTPAPFGGRVNIDVPLIPSLPEAPDVAIVWLRSTLGPLHLTYYERVHGKVVAYHPNGILLPDSCPHGGFPFAATFAFQDGSHASARTTVPCPRTRVGPRKIRSKS
jgi:hypothetical protein